MKYRLKNAETEAVQWDGSEEALEAIRAMVPNHEPVNNLWYVQINDIRFYTGQWIFPDLSRMNDDEFQKLYEPVTEPEACGWEESDISGDAWNSECGFRFYSYEGCENPLHKFNYCPKCGRKTEERK